LDEQIDAAATVAAGAVAGGQQPEETGEEHGRGRDASTGSTKPAK
jgi:hypothetical protein